jgi:MFS family permease
MERNIKLIALLNFFTDFVFFAPVAIIYFAKVTGSYTLGMSIFSVAYASSALFEIPTGIISDSVGRRLTTIFGALSAVLCIVFYAIGGSYWMLFIGGLIQGLSRAFYSGNNDALLHDSLKVINKEHNYHIHLGKTSSMFQVALALASVTGSVFAAVSFPLVMWISVLPQLGALIVALYLTEPPIKSDENTKIWEHLKTSVRQFQSNKKLQFLTIASTLRFSLGEAAYLLKSAFVNSLWPLWAVGFSNFLSNIGGAVSYFFSGKIINKYSHRTVLWFEIISNRIVNAIALLFPTVVSPVLMGSTSLTFGAGSVAINSLQQQEFTQSERATMGSIISFVENIAFGFVSLALGILADRLGPAKTLLIVQVLLLTPLFFYSKLFKHHENSGN